MKTSLLAKNKDNVSPVKYAKADALRSFFKDVFRKIKCPPELYEPVIEGLIETSLRGVDCHGIRLVPHYIEAALLGRINLAPKFVFRKTSPTTALLDADHTFGIAAASQGMNKAIELAEQFGVGCVVVSNSTHFGAAAIYALMAARHDMIGISLTNTDALVAPHGGKKRFLGTNPICFAAPCEAEDPFCLDMATSVISWNRLMQYRASGRSLKEGWAADRNGESCVDPNKVQVLLPIGEHKGYGLALMVEILCSLLAGMPYGPSVMSMFPVNGKKRHLSHFLMVIDIQRFQKISIFKKRIKTLLDELRSQPPAKNFGNVLVPNDPEKENYRTRIANGIPMDEVTISGFRRITNRCGIEMKKYPALFYE